jgi:hypothetical protein
LLFSYTYYSTMAVHMHILPGGWTLGLLVAAVQRNFLTPLSGTTYFFGMVQVQ